MIEFLRDQPAADHARIMEILAGDAVPMSVLKRLDFATTPLYLSNRTTPFTDLKWGHEWGAGAGLLIGMPTISHADNDLAPHREYKLGLPNDLIDDENWAAGLVDIVRDKPEYKQRETGLYGQLFDPDTDQPIGFPHAYDVGFMDDLSVSFPIGGAIISLTVESFLARKRLPVNGSLTYRDQKHRHPTDEGLEFVVDAANPVDWTNW